MPRERSDWLGEHKDSHRELTVPKLLEKAMAMGKAVVSTPAGVNGIPVVNGENAVIEAEAQAFAAAIESLSRNAPKRADLERSARRFALQFDWKEVGIRQSTLYRKLTG